MQPDDDFESRAAARRALNRAVGRGRLCLGVRGALCCVIADTDRGELVVFKCSTWFALADVIRASGDVARYYASKSGCVQRSLF